MTEQFQYPVLAATDPETLGDPEVVKEDWYQPLSQPVLRLPGIIFAAALIAAYGMAVIDPEILNEPEAPAVEQWWQPLSEPVLQPPGTVYAAAQAASGMAPIDSATLNAPEITERIEWFAELSQPVPPLPGVAYTAAIAAASGQAPIDPETLNLPDATPDDDTSLEDWWQALSEPVPPLAGLATANQQAFTIDPEILNEPEAAAIEHWWRPLSEPTPPLPGVAYAAAQVASGEAPIDPETLRLPAEAVIQLVRFDGSNDWLSNAAELTGNADSKVGTGSMWIRFEGGDGVSQNIYRSDTGQVFIHKTTGNVIRIQANNSVGTKILELDSNSTYTVASGIIHLCWSYDLANGIGRLFIDDADDLAASPTLTDDTIDYTDDGYGFGATELAGSNKITACVGQAYLNFAEFLDINDEGARRFFISANGLPVSLGADGSNPTGKAPIIFFDGAVASWHTNAGSGGGFAENGEITDCDVYPATTNIEQWWRALSEPVLQPPGNAYTAALAASGQAPIDPEILNAPEDVTLDGWLVALSEPVLQPLGNAYAAALAASGTPTIDPEILNQPEITDRIEWFTALSEPVLLIPRYQHPAAFDDPEALNLPDAAPADTSLEDWWRPLSQPVPPLAGVAYTSAITASGQAPIDPEILNQPEDVTLDGWLMPLSQPTPPLPGVAYTAAQAAAGAAPIDPETLNLPDAAIPDTSLEDWWRPLSEPIWQLPGIAYLAAQAASGTPTIDEETLGDPEVVRIEQWWRPLSQPVLQHPGIVYSAAQAASGGNDGGLLDPTASLSIAIGAATLTLTGQVPVLVWAPLYERDEYLVASDNEYIVRPE